MLTIQPQENNHYLIQGVLDFNSLMSILSNAKHMITDQTESYYFDLKGLTYSNSAGLSFMLALQRYAKKQKKTLHFLHLPPQLLAAATISNLEDLL